MRIKLVFAACLLVLLAVRVPAQITTPEVQPAASAKAGAGTELSPGAAYQEAMRPVEVTRSSLSNWSDVEQASLTIAMKRAADACAARTPSDYTGDSLVDLARLCALGQVFPAVIAATDRYMHEEGTAKLRLSEAYAARIGAELHLKDEPAALKSAQAMLAGLPYTSVVANASSEAIEYMQLLFTDDALSIAKARQNQVLALLRNARMPDIATSGASAEIPVVDLYRQALTLAELQQLEATPAEAVRTIATLDAVVPAALSADDRLAVDTLRKRYAQLGQPLAGFKPIAALDRPPHVFPSIPAHSAVTALLVFPDWCIQCVRLAQQMPSAEFSVQGHKAYMYGLLAQTVQPEKLPVAAGKKALDPAASFKPAYAAAYLRGSPTVTVTPSTLDLFQVTDVPLLILTDSRGIVRLIQVVDENALRPGNTLDSAVALVGARWPMGAP